MCVDLANVVYTFVVAPGLHWNAESREQFNSTKTNRPIITSIPKICELTKMTGVTIFNQFEGTWQIAYKSHDFIEPSIECDILLFFNIITKICE